MAHGTMAPVQAMDSSSHKEPPEHVSECCSALDMRGTDLACDGEFEMDSARTTNEPVTYTGTSNGKVIYLLEGKWSCAATKAEKAPTVTASTLFPERECPEGKWCKGERCDGTLLCTDPKEMFPGDKEAKDTQPVVPPSPPPPRRRPR